jgi:ABC-type multidrug transport system fused ATPase/permease subunit
MVVGVVAALAPALMPVVVGRGLDAVLDGSGTATWVWAVVGLGVLAAAAVAATQYLRTTMWIAAATSTVRVVLGHTARLGADVSSRVRAGEIVAVGSSDVYAIGTVIEMVGPLTGAVASYLVVGALLVQVSPLLGIVALIGVPLAGSGLTPLLGPLRRRTELHREQVGAVTELAGDIVSGLRVLRGVGGEQAFAGRFAATSQQVRVAGVEAGKVDAWLTGLEVLMPGLVTVAVTWLGARLALSGELSAGELVACYGLSACLVLPVAVVGESTHAIGAAVVAAGRVVDILALRPVLGSPVDPVPLPDGAFGLTDPATGLRCPPGALTVIRQGYGAGDLAARLALLVGSEVRAVAAGDTDAGDAGAGAAGVVAQAAAGVVAQAGGVVAQAAAVAAADVAAAAVTAAAAVAAVNADTGAGSHRPVGAGSHRPAGVALAAADLDEVRARILVAHHDDVLFTGRLADEVCIGDRVDLAGALWAADALDIPDGLPRGVRTVLSVRARELSGGQRARLMLARALTRDPDVLVLDEPTSAVDAHTVARIASRVAELRRGRTTVVIGGGPLWTAVADHVVDLAPAPAAARGEIR